MFYICIFYKLLFAGWRQQTTMWISARYCLTEWLSDWVTECMMYFCYDATRKYKTNYIKFLIIQVYWAMMTYDDLLLSDWFTDMRACRRWFCYEITNFRLVQSRRTAWIMVWDWWDFLVLLNYFAYTIFGLLYCV